MNTDLQNFKGNGYLIAGIATFAAMVFTTAATFALVFAAIA
jgi:hypothetical protein